MATFTHRIQMRRDSASDWTSINPTLAEGEIGHESDTTYMKIGDGSTAWTSLAYWPKSIQGNFYVASSFGVGTITPTSIVEISDSQPVMTLKDTDTAITTPGQLLSKIDFKTSDQSLSGGVGASIRIVVGNTSSGDRSDIQFHNFDSSSLLNRLTILADGDIGMSEILPDAKLCINQGAADDNILSFKSSDIAHGLIQVNETDTYTSMAKLNAAGGGLSLVGLTDGGETDGIGISLASYVRATANTSSTNAGRGLVEIGAVQHNGSNGFTNMAADGNALCLRTYIGSVTATQFIIKGNGDILYNGSAASYDGEIDAMACHDLSQVISSNYEKVMEYSREKLIKLGVLSEGGFVNIKKSRMLELGAIGELYKITAYLLEKMGLTYQDVKQELTEGNNGNDLRGNSGRKQRRSKNN